MKYKVNIVRMIDKEFEIEAEDEIDAEEEANKQFNELEIQGIEMYEHDITIEEISE